MKNLLYIFTVIFITSCSNTTDKNKGNISNEQTKPSNELEYLNARNNFIQYFKNKFENNPDYTDEIVKQNISEEKLKNFIEVAELINDLIVEKKIFKYKAI